MKFRAFILTYETGLDLKLSSDFSFRFLAVAWIWKHGEIIGINRRENKIIISKIIEVTK